jgi:hypothetical protein
MSLSAVSAPSSDPGGPGREAWCLGEREEIDFGNFERMIRF